MNPPQPAILPADRRCTSTKDFKTIAVKSWVLVLKTLGVVLFPCVYELTSTKSQAGIADGYVEVFYSEK